MKDHAVLLGIPRLHVMAAGISINPSPILHAKILFLINELLFLGLKAQHVTKHGTAKVCTISIALMQYCEG